MTEIKTAPFAKAALTMSLVSCSIAVLMTLSLFVFRLGVKAAMWVLLGGAFAIVWVLAPLTSLVILIGIIHKVKTKEAFVAWRRLGLAFIIGCVSVFVAVWAFMSVLVD
jgi:hypothetical protein